jgi:tRNA(adenine34) deaminase
MLRQPLGVVKRAFRTGLCDPRRSATCAAVTLQARFACSKSRQLTVASAYRSPLIARSSPTDRARSQSWQLEAGSYMTHEDAMRLALVEAGRARTAGEVPVGAIVIIDGVVVGSGFNQPISAVDPTAHAEVIALRAAARAVNNYRLTGAVLYVTVEPCLMCVGAMIHARVMQVVFGAPEPKAGALVSAARVHERSGLNHRLDVLGGVLEEECRLMMQSFFEDRRRSAG